MDKRKIIIIGPAYPYRGGIAQYNDRLAEALKQTHEAIIFSFKRMYPSWLYPGASDKEVGMAGQQTATRGVIDVYNPFTLLSTIRQIKHEKPDTILITWWTLFWQPAMAFLAWRFSRSGIKTVFICHNVFDHDGNGLKQAVGKKLLSTADGYIVHSSTEKDTLKALYPSKPVLQRLLPIYSQFPPPSEALPRRAQLELIFFGFIRPYKGLDVLLDAMTLLPDSTNVYLSVVGEYWGEAQELEDMVAQRKLDNVELVNRYVSMEEAANYFERADICVLPYISATGSAVLSLAYNFNVPVIASRAGGLKDAVTEGKTGWLVTPSDTKELARIIIDRIGLDKKTMQNDIETFCKNNDWLGMAAAIADFTATIKKA
ncbi:MAG TPA: glycosyltransferase family 4 protein [Candidatus Saccharibacteria bacterium]|nr:glycosyltransferase family 4 protein [Candidatus Saccharibacteria bacterium]HRK93972.1 glycosyltransferase family 4 protein [Candidatus Saccharibacteria bacterium]